MHVPESVHGNPAGLGPALEGGEEEEEEEEEAEKEETRTQRIRANGKNNEPWSMEAPRISIQH